MSRPSPTSPLAARCAGTPVARSSSAPRSTPRKARGRRRRPRGAENPVWRRDSPGARVLERHLGPQEAGIAPYGAVLRPDTDPRPLHDSVRILDGRRGGPAAVPRENPASRSETPLAYGPRATDTAASRRWESTWGRARGTARGRFRRRRGARSPIGGARSRRYHVSVTTLGSPRRGAGRPRRGSLAPSARALRAC